MVNLAVAVPKHGRNKQKHINKAKAALSRMGGVVSGNVSKKRKPREVELPVLLARDTRCLSPKVSVKQTPWVEGTMTDSELEALWSRLADKMPSAFNQVS